MLLPCDDHGVTSPLGLPLLLEITNYWGAAGVRWRLGETTPPVATRTLIRGMLGMVSAVRGGSHQGQKRVIYDYLRVEYTLLLCESLRVIFALYDSFPSSLQSGHMSC